MKYLLFVFHVVVSLKPAKDRSLSILIINKCGATEQSFDEEVKMWLSQKMPGYKQKR
jgi:hypothetical protein